MAKCKAERWDLVGKATKPRKTFFLRLAAETIFEVNSKKDKHGLNYARKAMIRCGLSLGVDGTWKPSQLFPHLQVIISKFPEHFEGKPVGNSNNTDEADAECDNAVGQTGEYDRPDDGRCEEKEEQESVVMLEAVV